jgi:choline dehydrogenase
MEGNRVTGVTYQRGNVTETVTADAEVILSAGAVASPQILMLSGIGPGAHLREMGIDVRVDSAGVGQNLQDHPVSGGLFYTSGTSDLAEFLTMGNLLKAQKAGRGPLSSNLAEAGGFFKSRDDLDAPDLQFHMVPGGFYDNGLHEPVRRGLTIAPTLVRVESRGHIKLRSADPTWHPEIEPGYFDDGADLDAMVAAYGRLFEIVGQGPVATFIDEPWDPPTANPTHDDVLATIGRLCQTLYHPVATCAMGTIEGSVVGPDLRVYGVENLRVADASVMPAVPRGNTNAPTIMVGEKAADLIKESR